MRRRRDELFDGDGNGNGDGGWGGGNGDGDGDGNGGNGGGFGGGEPVPFGLYGDFEMVQVFKGTQDLKDAAHDALREGA